MKRGALVVLFVLLGAGYAWLTAFDELGSLHGDGLIYFLTAMQYAPYWPADALAEAVARTSQFPPIYPLLLVACGGAASFLVAHLATTLFLLAAFAAFHAWLRVLGLSALQACAGTAVFAILPGTFEQALYLHPEGLYVALVFLAMIALEKAEQSGRANYYWAASVAFAAALLTRSAGVTLIPGLALVLLRRRPQRAAGMMLLPLVAAGTWAALHHPSVSYTQALVESYGSTARGPALWSAIVTHVNAVADSFAWNVFSIDKMNAGAAVLGSIALAVVAWRIIRGKPDAWYVACYLALLAIWPYPQEFWRLVWVVVPVVIGQMFWAAREIAERTTARAVSRPVRSGLRWAPIAVIALTVTPTFAFHATRAVDAVRLGEPELRHLVEWYIPESHRAHRLARASLEVVQALREFAPRIPADACVFSPSPLVTAYFTDRESRFSPLEARSEAGFNGEIRESGCRYFVMLGSVTRYSASFYPRDRLGNRITIVAEHKTGGEPVALLGVLRTPNGP